jgi:MoaA/NifB/PqqE/SkfB family radical SAM enzyme
MVSFHVEPTSRCTLECPLCDRTWFYETFKKRNLHEINIDHIVSFIGKNATISLCGNNGDPIYHSKFLELCKKFKDNNCSIHIHTNGTAKTKTWWNKLNSLLKQDDIITFAIDGLEDTNHLYRKNAKWKSIMSAVQTLKKRKFKMIWQFIPFNHNQHQIPHAKKLSKKLGFDNFQLKPSTRWLDKKELMPDRKYIDKRYKIQKEILNAPHSLFDMSPQCLKNNLPKHNLYIDAEGDFYPCCFIGTYRYKYKSLFSPKSKKFNIKNNTIEKILENPKIKKFFTTTKHFNSAHECCKIHCGVRNG